MTISPVLGYPYEESFFSTQYSYFTRFQYWGTLTTDRFPVLNTLNSLYTTYYRVTRRVFSEAVTSKLHLLYTKNLACQLKTPKVIRISAMHANFSHSPVHSGPICFHMTKNLKLPSGTNKTK